ncbi:beta-lactamase family protein [Fulvivirga ulvae]|uniref:serine hydrolase domain-containing protein n=1 Tax=Fulvivirga ulvae TaxID=2904245 RepID=UPI001F27CC5D|nr:serine hydrolase domain-containing protein [Fulvivirga ulvae]UII33614.1 beta-lactamase family protein [Fulvivirga ulvae]
MNTITITVQRIIFCVLLILSSAALGQADGYFTSNGKDVHALTFDLEIEQLMSELGIPALSIAILEDGKTAYSNVYGYKKMGTDDAADLHTAFEACSLSKIFLVFSVYKLVDKGVLDLDVPLFNYHGRYKPLMHDKRYKKITARMILSHTSGIENWTSENDPKVLEILEEPGKTFIYSGEGFLYLTEVMEHLLSESFVDFTNRLVLEPLGLKDTYMWVSDGMEQTTTAKLTTSNYVTGHDIFGNVMTKAMDYDADKLPASYIHTTAADYAKLVLSFFDKETFSETIHKEMLESLVLLQPLDNFSVYTGPGFSVLRFQEEDLLFFNGSNSGFKSTVIYSDQNQRGFIFFTNSDSGKRLMYKINQLTTEFDLELENGNPDMYPSTPWMLFHVYRRKGSEALFRKLDYLKGKNMLQTGELEELASIISRKDGDLSEKVRQYLDQ